MCAPLSSMRPSSVAMACDKDFESSAVPTLTVSGEMAAFECRNGGLAGAGRSHHKCARASVDSSSPDLIALRNATRHGALGRRHSVLVCHQSWPYHHTPSLDRVIVVPFAVRGPPQLR